MGWVGLLCSCQQMGKVGLGWVSNGLGWVGLRNLDPWPSLIYSARVDVLKIAFCNLLSILLIILWVATTWHVSSIHDAGDAAEENGEDTSKTHHSTCQVVFDVIVWNTGTHTGKCTNLAWTYDFLDLFIPKIVVEMQTQGAPHENTFPVPSFQFPQKTLRVPLGLNLVN